MCVSNFEIPNEKARWAALHLPESWPLDWIWLQSLGRSAALARRLPVNQTQTSNTFEWLSEPEVGDSKPICSANEMAEMVKFKSKLRLFKIAPTTKTSKLNRCCPQPTTCGKLCKAAAIPKRSPKNRKFFSKCKSLPHSALAAYALLYCLILSAELALEEVDIEQRKHNHHSTRPEV